MLQQPLFVVGIMRSPAFQRRVVPIALCALAMLAGVAPGTLRAQDGVHPRELDTFWIGLGTANIVQSEGFEIGYLLDGAIRLSLTERHFLEIGYSTSWVSFVKDVSGQVREFHFRTTGPFTAIGTLIPLHKGSLGLRGELGLGLYEQEQRNDVGAILEEKSGVVVTVAGAIFTQLAERHEWGIRIGEFIGDTDAGLNFGVYYHFHFAR
jgi:hypothetical protein